MLICLLEDGPRCQRKLIHSYEHDAKGKHCFSYRRRYKNRQLRARGFLSSGDAEQHLNQAMLDVDAVHRGEFRGKPTTAQDALNIYRRRLEVRAQ